MERFDEVVVYSTVCALSCASTAATFVVGATVLYEVPPTLQRTWTKLMYGPRCHAGRTVAVSLRHFTYYKLVDLHEW